MSIKKKNINEMSAVGNVGGFGGPLKIKTKDFFKSRRNRKSKNSSAPFEPSGSGIVFPKKKGPKRGKDVKDYKNGKVVSAERKSERMLRESIRNLVLLSRVKYHEEQALREMQEQKLRRIIRHLINEGNEPSSTYSSTGETAGASYVDKITVTLKQYAALVSTQAQREEFKKIYLTGIKNYLDALDEQYYILNPEERPGAVPQQPAPASPVAPQPINQQQPPAGALKEQASLPPAIGTPSVNPLSGIDNKNMVAQATAAAVQTVGAKNKTGHGAAEEALNRDLPQIDPLYNNLTFEEFTVSNADGSSRTTNDRKDFRIMLIGDQATNNIGNIANEFIKIDIAKQTNDSPHKNDPSNTPPLERNPAAQQTPPPGPEQTPPAPPEGEMEPPPEGEEEQPEI